MNDAFEIIAAVLNLGAILIALILYCSLRRLKDYFNQRIENLHAEMNAKIFTLETFITELQRRRE